MPIEYHQRTFSLEISHELCYTYMRWNTYEHMDVIRTCLCFYYFHPFLCAQFPQYFSDIFSYLSVYLFSSIFRCEDYMILASVFWVCGTFYFVICIFIKIDILLFYLQLLRNALPHFIVIGGFFFVYIFGLLLARRFYCRPALSSSPGRTGGLFPRINAPKICTSKSV